MSGCPAGPASQPYIAVSKLQSSIEALSATLLSAYISTTWLDVYPPTETTEEMASTAPSAPPTLNSTRITRINTIKEILSNDIKPNIEIREHFLRLETHGREVCFFCSAADDPSANCGSTCAQLRPQLPLRVASFNDSSWREETIQSVKTYHRILEEIEEKGSRARNSQVLTWEEAVQVLRKDTLNQSEIKDENGWSNLVGYSKAKKAGVDIEWTFGSAWGTGLPPDEEIAPDENVPGDSMDGPRVGRRPQPLT